MLCYVMAGYVLWLLVAAVLWLWVMVMVGYEKCVGWSGPSVGDAPSLSFSCVCERSLDDVT